MSLLQRSAEPSPIDNDSLAPAFVSPNHGVASRSKADSPCSSEPLNTILVDDQHPLRDETESFIACRYAQVFQARLGVYMPTLVRFETANGRLVGALGLRSAEQEALFVESYLDLPAEQAVAQALSRPVSRSKLLEVGNLAVARGISGRQVVVAMTALLAESGFHYVIFAATANLRATFRRLGLTTVELSGADPRRLGPCAGHWGLYYESQPRVLCGALEHGVQRLQKAGLL